MFFLKKNTFLGVPKCFFLRIIVVIDKNFKSLVRLYNDKSALITEATSETFASANSVNEIVAGSYV
jgi:hypothetical protein